MLISVCGRFCERIARDQRYMIRLTQMLATAGHTINDLHMISLSHMPFLIIA